MEEISPKQLQKLQKAEKIVSGGSIAIADHLLDIEDRIDEIIPEVNAIVEEVKKEKGEQGDRGERGDKGDRGEKGDKGDQGIQGIPGKEGKKGKDGKDGRDGIDGLDAEITPELKDELILSVISELPEDEELSPLAIKESLERLEGEERLDAKAIKNLPQFTREVIRDVGAHGGAYETPIKAGANTTVRKDPSGSWVIDSGVGLPSSVTNSDGSLTISPTTGNVVASLNIGHANTWTADQTVTAKINNYSGQLTGTGDQTSGGTTSYQNYETGLGYAAAWPTSQVTGMAGTKSGALSGTGGTGTVWTMEAWCVLRGNYTGANSPTIYAFGGNTVQLRFAGLAPQAFWFGTPNDAITSATNVTLGVPFHVAFDSDGANNVNMWLNGVNVGTKTNFPNYALGSNSYIGNIASGIQSWPGLISELRISNIRRYTSGFTPSTTAWANDVNTVALFQFKDANATQFTDYSGNGNHYTLTGTPKPTYDVGNISYTAFRNAISRAGNAITIGQYGDASATFNTTTFLSSVTNNSTETAWTFNTPVALSNIDNRLVSFQNNSIEKFGLFQDGALSKLPLPIKQAAGASNDFINLDTSSSEIKWKVDSFYNQTAGSTKMTTSGDRTVGGLLQLNNFEGSGGFAQGFSVINTNVANIKFPSYGAAFTPFTLEAWVYVRSLPAGSNLQHVCNNSNSTANDNIRLTSSGNFFFQTSNQGLNMGAGVLNTWQHVAVTWDGITTRGFVNGVLGASSTLYFGQPDAQYLGNSYLTSCDLIIQEYRCSDIARYTTSFTPPTGPFTTDANTRLLAHLNGNANDSSGSARNGTITGTLATDYAWVTGQVAVTNSTRNAITRQFEVSTGKNYVQIGESTDDYTRLVGGNIGIGTSTPTSPLNVVRNIVVTAATNGLYGVDFSNTYNPNSSDGTTNNIGAANYQMSKSGNNTILNNIENLFAFKATVYNGGNGQINNFVSNISKIIADGTGPIVNAINYLASSPSGGGGASAITTSYGLYINAQKTAVVSGTGYGVYQVGASDTNLFNGVVNVANDIKITTAGKTLYVKSGTNAKIGTATLVGGTVTVSTTAINATGTSMIILSPPRGTLVNVGELEETARTAGTSFTVTSSNILDTCTFDWLIVEITP